ncbi:hypothetical protein A2634_02590 [Candidatus Amesbacteria bacterium RIFCSPHIGHO2_01_FULL_48_32]|uniref:ATP synthase F1 complex delta/epsilon subunit N-terminal domain-containing protein n=1 Tax=Candidatus Amesbacteria bacterium RIFCSPLOWO2_01_FULL_48_25 TaxID=1797259 RepID=A0A1F4ZD37_9BACT|nr:MAG: hypothetical protein A2634_02590 [Candidatus Amesbacteria bacterium RIFCSPHIGHO2_01_FULL_48_32]OGD04201.1 MAG: hypothetical protein A2989_01845 [Candidatus Amesbacteria bacterium RIFCSPLOWO2_01_FULL_48_25]
MADSDVILARVRNRQGLVFEGQVRAVSSVNKKGPFDILLHHANFVCTIQKKLTLHRVDGKKMEIAVDSGIMEVHRDQVLVFLGVV